jgi:hypothetical protein
VNLLPRTHAALDRLNADELEVVARFIAKLEAGKIKHGPLDLASDTRDMLAEWEAEAVDGAAYAIMATIKARRARERGEPGDIEAALRELADADATTPRARFDISDIEVTK